MRSKKGVEMAISSIVVIVLALIVLVVLAIGFASGWKGLWDRMTTFGGGEGDAQTVIEACQIACAKQSTYDFCKKSWKIGDDYIGDSASGEEGSKTIKCFEIYGDQGLSCDMTCSTNNDEDKTPETPVTPQVPGTPLD